MKKCNICKIEKELVCFAKNRKKKDGLQNRCALCQKEYRARNKESINQLNREYRQLSHVKEQRRVRRNAGGAEKFNRNTLNGRAAAMYHTAKKGAEQRGMTYELTLDWFKAQLAIGHCAVTKIPFVLSAENDEHTVESSGQLRNPFAPSVDRKDNDKDYTPENCHLVAAIHNMAKGAYRDNSLKQYIRSLSGWANT